MSATRRHLEFAPPPTPGLVRAFGLALLAHLALLAVLTVGVAWKREAPQATVEAELWSSVPQEAAPLPQPEPEPEPPQPEPPVQARPTPPAPPVADTPKAADIALAREKEKEKARLEKEKELQQAKLEQERKAKLEKLAAEKKAAEKLAADKQRKEQDAKLAREKAEKTDKAKAETLAKQKADKAAELAAQKNREDQLKRMAALAGGPTGSGGAGTAEKSAGMSSNYSGRIAASIKRGMVYTKTVVGNPRVEVEINAAPDGAILSRRVTKASGTPSWDQAVLDAIDKLTRLPLNESGRVPPSMTIGYSAEDMIGR